MWEQMLQHGLMNHQIDQIPGFAGVANRYQRFYHFGSVSWDLDLLPEHRRDIEMRRDCVRLALIDYKDVDLKGKFVAPTS